MVGCAGGASCSGHGSCDDSTGAPVCTCDPGYTGTRCGACADGYQVGEGGVCVGCSIGPCCDNGALRPADAVCATWSTYSCASAWCGADALRKDFTQRCPGTSGECSGAVSSSEWLVDEDCTDDQVCETVGETAATCRTCFRFG